MNEQELLNIISEVKKINDHHTDYENLVYVLKQLDKDRMADVAGYPTTIKGN